MAAQDRAKKQTDCQTFSLTPAAAQERLAYRKTFKKSTVSSQPLAVVYVKARAGGKKVTDLRKVPVQEHLTCRKPELVLKPCSMCCANKSAPSKNIQISSAG